METVREPQAVPATGGASELLTSGESSAANDASLDQEQLASIERHEREVARLQAKSSRRLERSIALAMDGLTILAIVGSQSIPLLHRVSNDPIDPRWWPTALSLIAFAMAVALTVIAFTRPPFEREGIEATNRTGWFRLLITIVLETLFILAWYQTGNFVVPSVLMLAAMLWVYGSRSWKVLIAFPILTTALIYALFALLLRIPL